MESLTAASGFRKEIVEGREVEPSVLGTVGMEIQCLQERQQKGPELVAVPQPQDQREYFDGTGNSHYFLARRCQESPVAYTASFDSQVHGRQGSGPVRWFGVRWVRHLSPCHLSELGAGILAPDLQAVMDLASIGGSCNRFLGLPSGWEQNILEGSGVSTKCQQRSQPRGKLEKRTLC